MVDHYYDDGNIDDAHENENDDNDRPRLWSLPGVWRRDWFHFFGPRIDDSSRSRSLRGSRTLTSGPTHS